MGTEPSWFHVKHWTPGGVTFALFLIGCLTFQFVLHGWRGVFTSLLGMILIILAFIVVSLAVHGVFILVRKLNR